MLFSMWVRHLQGCAWRYWGWGLGWEAIQDCEGDWVGTHLVLRGWGMRLAMERVSVMTELPRSKSQVQPLDLCALVCLRTLSCCCYH